MTSMQPFAPCSSDQRSASPLLPSAPIGTFRLFRLLSLYPSPAIELKVFSYPEPTSPSFEQEPNVARLTFNDSGTNEDAYSAQFSRCPPYDAISYTWNPNSQSNPRPEADPQDSPIEYLVRNDLHGTEHENSVPSQPITVHTKPAGNDDAEPLTIHISDHLLYGLLTTQELHSPTWLFVDAICIDQTDPWDKSLQVLGMDRVFGGANKVFIWLGMDLNPPGLGSSFRDTHDVLDMQDMNESIHSLPYANVEADADGDLHQGVCLTYVPMLADKLDTYLSSRQRERDYRLIDTSVHTQHGSSNRPLASSEAFSLLTSVSHTLWSALERLRLNPWFSRLWVLQELALAQDAILLYGQHSLPWPVYARFTALCEKIIGGPVPHGYESDLVNQLYLAYNGRVSAMEKLKMESQRVSSLNPNGDNGNQNPYESVLIRLLIHNIRKCQCTLPIDRVYAISGLLSSRMKESIRLNYSLYTQNQYWNTWMEFFKVVLTFAPEVATDLFSSATYLQRHHKLPSWCPNLTDDGERRSLHSAATGAGMPSGKRWEPHRNDQPEDMNNGQRRHTATLIPGTSRIRLLGLQVDELLHIIDLSWIKDSLQWTALSVHQSDNIPSDVARDVLATLWKCLEHLRQLGNSTSDGDAILARCLVTDSYDGEHPVDLEQLLDDYTSFTHCLEHYTWGPSSGGTLKSDMRTAGFRFGDRFQRLARKRAFFVTRLGRSGLCSCNAGVGDVLCVMMNYRMPYLLRRTSGGDSAAETRIRTGVGSTAVESGHGVNAGSSSVAGASASNSPTQLFELVGETYVDGIMRGEVFVGRDMNKEQPDEFIVC